MSEIAELLEISKEAIVSFMVATIDLIYRLFSHS